MEKRKKRSSRTTEHKVSQSTKALMEAHQFREILYLFLSRSLSREVDAPLLQNARIILKSLQHLREDPLVRGRLLLEDFFQETKKMRKEVILRNLAEQYASLFLGVGPENISLCESAYRNEKGLLFQNSYFEILEEYRKAGLTKREDFTEPEDHLAVELAFMANLCRWSIATIQKGEEQETERSYLLQKTFLDGHLNPWVHQFTKGLLNLSPSGFYGAVAHLLKGYLEVDRSWIDEFLTEIGRSEDQFSEKTRKPSGREVKKQAVNEGGSWKKPGS